MISRCGQTRPCVEDFVALPVTILDVPKAPTMAEDLTEATVSLEVGGQRAAVVVGVCHTRCAFGGYRRWWRCPVCHSRRAKLLVQGLTVACRACFGASYRSQRRWPRWTATSVASMAVSQTRLAEDPAPRTMAKDHHPN